MVRLAYLPPLTPCAVATISQHITCQSSGVYPIYWSKDTDPCARVRPTYLGICREGEHSNFTIRLGQHLGKATQACHADTVTPVGHHFRLPGYRAHRDLVMIPLEALRGKDPFLLRARETFNIVKFKSEKSRGVEDIEHGLNLDGGQV